MAEPESPAVTKSPAVSENDVLQALGGVTDPELSGDVVELGMVRGVGVDGSTVRVELALTIAACPLRSQLRGDVERRVKALPGVNQVEVVTVVMEPGERSALMARARRLAQERAPTNQVPLNAKVLALASGKGGVGKSSMSVNLAAALAKRGLTVGLLDADIWGHSVPRLLSMEGSLEARSGRIIPFERPIGSGRLRVVSMGFLSGEDEAIMWRGLMLNRAVQHFLEDVSWGDLDYLVIDLPPGTGDVQMGLARMMPRTELLVVTTPNSAAEKVAGRVADMARRGHIRVAGVVENMSGFTCAHGETYELFGSGGGRRLADRLGVPLLGSVPLTAEMVSSAEAGVPVSLEDSGALPAIFDDMAERLATELAPPLEMAGCSARMLQRVAEALGEEG